MKKNMIILISLIFLSLSAFTQDTNDEWRATWVITWNYFPSGPTTVENDKARIRKIMDDHQAANMNAVLWQARQSGTAYYNSSYEPWGSYADGSYPGFDPLEYAVEQAHLRGMEIHAWFNAFHAASTASGTPAGDHPDWVCRDGDGNPMPRSRALSPGMQDVRDYTLNVAMELVNNYDIDGLHLDYIRWNEYNTTNINAPPSINSLVQERPFDGDFDEALISAVAAPDPNRYLYDIDHPYSGGIPSGYASWEDYWRASVTDFVVALHDSIQDVKPWVRLSPAALGKYNWSSWQGYGYVYQDAALWFNEGYIDQLTPMMYHWTSQLSFNDALRLWGENLTKGINEGNMFTAGPGSYMFEDYGVWNNHPSVVAGARTKSWVDGFQFFSYGSWRDKEYWDYAGDTFFSRRTKVRDTGRIVATTPVTPVISLQKLDPLQYEIMVTPPSGLSEKQWFVIYRDALDSIDQDQSTIVDIHFGQNEYSFTDVFSGDQDHNAAYYYGATMLDRYWNESLTSNLEVSDPLPSAPPRVMTFSPADSDLVGVTELIDIHFSKAMDISSVEANLSIVPSASFIEYRWTDDNHRLRLNVDGNFEYGTSYVITLGSGAMDINGVAFDGNGDGVPGDAYTSTFRTYDVDNLAPELLSNIPSLDVSNEHIDTHANFSFKFDELLDPETVNETSITMWSEGTQLAVKPVHSANETRSIIDVRAEDLLEPGDVYEIHLGTGITDTSGNAFTGYVYGPFMTEREAYSEILMIDDLRGASGIWEWPGYSGTTHGLKAPATSTLFEYTSLVYLPASSLLASRRKSALLEYYWDPSYDEIEGAFMIREYLAGGDARDVTFDKNNILQCFVYGDNSLNLLRIALDEKTGSGIWSNHEVTTWVTVNWEGWKLIEWDLTDPNIVGSWIGNEKLDGAAYRIDSFQLTYDQVNGDSLGRIYFDELRVVKKISTVDTQDDFAEMQPTEVSLNQNYPNPFNPETQISFALPMAMQARLAVYDVRGREVVSLIDQQMHAGVHKLSFNGSDLAAGVYLLRLETQMGNEVKRMLLLK